MGRALYLFVETLATLLAGMLMGSLIFVYHYQENLAYVCVDAVESEVLEDDENYRSLPAVVEGERCYATLD